MALVKWSSTLSSPAGRPMAEFDTLRWEIDRVLNTFWLFGSGEMAPIESVWAPRVDLIEQDDAYVLQANLPGMHLEDIDIQFHAGTLMLKGKHKLEHEAHNGYHRRERAYGAFYRNFTLGTSVEMDKISATYKNGVLEVHVPKAAEAKPKRIAVQTAEVLV